MRSTIPFFLLAFAAVPVFGQTLDQTSSGVTTHIYNFGRDAAMAQVFTVGLEGRLVQIEVDVSNSEQSTSEDLTVMIVRAPDGVPSTDSSDALFTTTVEADDVGPMRTSVLLTGLSVPAIAGDSLAIVLDAPEDAVTGFNTWSAYAQGGRPTFEDTYPDGALFRLDRLDRPMGTDIGFRTWMDRGSMPPVAPIPTLGAYQLLLLGVLLLGLGLMRFQPTRS